MILNRYLIREIASPLGTITIILVMIFMSYNAARYTTAAAAGLMPASTVFYLTLLKSLIAIEVLLPVALYLSVVMGIGRMYSDNEIVAIHSLGISEVQLLHRVFWFFLVIALLVAGLSLVVRPWAYQESFLLRAQAKAEFNLDKLESGQFYSAEKSGTVIYVNSINRAEHRLEQVYFYQIIDGRVLVIQAEEAWQPVTDPFAPPVLRFRNGAGYHIDQLGTLDVSMNFKDLSILLKGDDDRLYHYKSKAADTLALFGSDRPNDLAELQWRFTTPATAMLLGILAVPLCRTSPRSSRYSKAIIAAFIYAIFYTLSVMAKNWVEQGVVGVIPGLWWPNALLALLILLLMLPKPKTSRQ
ncbi:MAG: LPS export ABC transporter permease LptF [Gammaproteobacteria bacterium]|nr:LPS export ABC transporter permease LptF [Gammaproteobacteria bacterium]